MAIQEKIDLIKTQVANAHTAVGTKGGTPGAGTSSLEAAIFSIPEGGGTDTSDANATAEQILEGFNAYVDGEKVEGAIATYTGSDSFVPTTSNIIIPTGSSYVETDLTIVGSANLVNTNIKKDVVIFGVTGSYEGSGGGLTDAGILNVSNNGSYTPTAGSGYTAVNVNVPTGGGGTWGSWDAPEAPPETIYVNVEKVVSRTPADATTNYAGVWTRDAAWLALADVPMTFQSGSFGWTGTRALARYTKTVNGTVVYLYLYQLDGYYYDDTTAWDAVGVANAQQFFDNIGTLGWSGEMTMYYGFSTTDYTPAQITGYNSVVGNTEIGAVTAAHTMSVPLSMTGPWNLLGLDEMGMGMEGDILQTYSNQSSTDVTVAFSDNPNSNKMYNWDYSSIGDYNSTMWGRMLNPTSLANQGWPADAISGEYVLWNGEPLDPSGGPLATQGKRYEWYNTTRNTWAAEYLRDTTPEAFTQSGHGGWPTTCGFGFLHNRCFPSFARESHHNAKELCRACQGSLLMPLETFYTIEITDGGTGYVVGDLFWTQIYMRNRGEMNVDIPPGTKDTDWSNSSWIRLLLLVTSVDENGAVTGVSEHGYWNYHWARNSNFFLGNWHLCDATSNTLVTSMTFPNNTTSEYTLHDTNGAGSGVIITITRNRVCKSIFASPGDYYILAAQGRDNEYYYSSQITSSPYFSSYGTGHTNIPTLYEVYKVTTSLTPFSVPNDFTTWLLLHFDEGAGVTKFVDSSGNNITITNNSTAIAGVTTGKFGGCIYHSAADTEGVQPNNAAIPTVLGNDWTLECWVKKGNVTAGRPICGNDWWNLGTLGMFDIDGFIDIPFTNPITYDDTWHHVAVVKDGITLKCYIDGVLEGSLTSGDNDVDYFTDNFVIGAAGFGNNCFEDGYIDEFRITEGIRYTDAFTPPTAPFTS